MAAIAAQRRDRRSSYSGLRLSADEYSALPDDGNKYELIDGVVVMSPSPGPRHQLVAKVILRQLDDHVERCGLGLVLYETDIRISAAGDARDLVYRPEIIFVAAARVGQIRGRIEIVPDVVVEVISPESRSLDTQTKLADYERAGVREYWLIDPIDAKTTFYRLSDGKFSEAPTTSSHYESQIVAGFRLDLEKVRAAFHALG